MRTQNELLTEMVRAYEALQESQGSTVELSDNYTAGQWLASRMAHLVHEAAPFVEPVQHEKGHAALVDACNLVLRHTEEMLTWLIHVPHTSEHCHGATCHRCATLRRATEMHDRTAQALAASFR